MIIRKHKKICWVLNYTEHLLILASTITGFITVSSFSSLVGIPVDIASSATAIKICAITAGINKSKSIIRSQ